MGHILAMRIVKKGRELVGVHMSQSRRAIVVVSERFVFGDRLV